MHGYTSQWQGLPAPSPFGGFKAGGNFGTFGGAAKQLGTAERPITRRRSVNCGAAVLSLLVPCLVFAMVCGVLSLVSVRQDKPLLTWITMGLAGFGALALAGHTALISMRRWRGEQGPNPYWYVFLTATLLAAWGVAFWLGELNWWNNVLPYTNLQGLSVRYDVDPANAQGQQHMDVGRIVFAKGARLEANLSISFKNVEQYCVAPIVGSSHTGLPSYDFWAVGLDCCSGGSPAVFQCGEYSNPKARGGLRVMREEQRAFYHLAVQQAEAAYNIRAQRPLFFYWMEDPIAELESYSEESRQFLLLGVLSFSALQLLLVLAAVFVQSKL